MTSNFWRSLALAGLIVMPHIAAAEDSSPVSSDTVAGLYRGDQSDKLSELTDEQLDAILEQLDRPGAVDAVAPVRSYRVSIDDVGVRRFDAESDGASRKKN